MNLDDIYSSWLKASMIKDRAPLQVTIQRWDMVEFEDKSKPGGKKRQISIEVGERSPLGLNVTNAKAIAHYLGTEDPNEWVGKSIVLVVEQVESFGRWEEAIRIKSAQQPTMQGQPVGGQMPQQGNPVQQPQGYSDQLTGSHPRFQQQPDTDLDNIPGFD